MEEFSFGRAWTQGYQFVARGTAIHFLILVVIGILAPIAVQYALAGMPMDTTRSPMVSGMSMMEAIGGPGVLLALAIANMLQLGSYYASLRFGFTNYNAPAAIMYGLGAGGVGTLIVAAGYAVAVFGGQALSSPGAFELAVLIFVFPVMLVYSMFFVAQAALGAATILLALAFLLFLGLISGNPGLPALAFQGSGAVVVIMLVMSGFLFWFAARFSCVTALMAQRGSLNVFGALADSWRMTADDQGRITRYLMAVGFGVAVVIIGLTLIISGGTGGLTQGGRLGLGETGDTIVQILFGIPVAFLSVILPAGIYRALTGEDTPAEIFE